jgi:hypothetical protein
VWVSAAPLGAASGVGGNACRRFLSARWTIRVDRDEGPAVLGHELFHARYHDELADVPAVWEEGLADRFGLAPDVLGDGARAARLFAASGETQPEVELVFALADGTYSGAQRIVPAARASRDPEVARALSLTRAELARSSTDERRRLYGIGFALVERGLASEDPAHVPLDGPPPAPEPDALARWASDALDAELRWRWVLWAAAPAVVGALEGAPRAFVSPEECLAALRFDLRVGDGELRGLNEDAAFREALEILWPLIRPPR